MKNRIEEIRKGKGIRQEDFAKIMGVSRQTISSLETGKYNPSIFLAYKIAKYLVEKGADIYYQDTHDTVMSLAVMIWDRDFEETRKESFEFVKYLIEHNVDTDCPTGRVRNVFNSAAYYGHNLVVEYLLDEEIYNINSVDELGITALIAAATGGHIETVQMLLTRGADVNIYDSYGKTACDYAIEGNYTEIADLLHFYGA